MTFSYDDLGRVNARVFTDNRGDLYVEKTAEQVAAMRAQGLDRATVEGLRATYQKAIEAGGAKLQNEQLLPRAQLMDRILELWPK